MNYFRIYSGGSPMFVDGPWGPRWTGGSSSGAATLSEVTKRVRQELDWAGVPSDSTEPFEPRDYYQRPDSSGFVRWVLGLRGRDAKGRLVEIVVAELIDRGVN